MPTAHSTDLDNFQELFKLIRPLPTICEKKTVTSNILLQIFCAKFKSSSNLSFQLKHFQWISSHLESGGIRNVIDYLAFIKK